MSENIQKKLVRCNLSEEINDCEFYNRERKICTNLNKCSFQYVETNNNKNSGKKKERWYEKYYRNGEA